MAIVGKCGICSNKVNSCNCGSKSKKVPHTQCPSVWSPIFVPFWASPGFGDIQIGGDDPTCNCSESFHQEDE